MINQLFKLFGKARVFKFMFNISPMYRRTGGRLIQVSHDLSHVRIKLALNYKTKNYVGTIYGGNLYSSVDGIYMLQLIQILGKDYIVWDKAATIKFKKPANTNLFADFIIDNVQISDIKYHIAKHNEKDFAFNVVLKDKEEKIYAEVEKVIYIADRKFYKHKRTLKESLRE